MVPPCVRIVDDSTLKNAEEEVATVLVHLKKLSRAKNRLCSPFLRLPTEIVIHILSFLMEDMGSYTVWRPIFTTCYHIRRIMRNATTLWWKLDISFGREADVALMRSKGSPRAVIARFSSSNEWENLVRGDVLNHWKDQWVLQGHRLHTLDFLGSPSNLPHLSWIFEGPLPSLKRLKLHVVAGGHDDAVLDPFILQLPIDTPLRALDLRNATLPWSSHLFTGLSELHLDFRDVTVSIGEVELFEILDASPQLERLSLLRIDQTIPTNVDQRPPPKRIVRLPGLVLLKLYNDPNVVGYILAHLDIPALTSLEIRSRVSHWDFARSLNYFFPDDRLPRRLFSDPPSLVLWRHFVGTPSLEFSIGRFKVQFDLQAGNDEASRNATAACVLLVPPSVTALKLGFPRLGVREWKRFFRLHPEVRSIECTEFKADLTCEPFWDALSLAEDEDPVILCPRLESIVLNVRAATAHLIPLFRCLQCRGSAGFRLRHLKIVEPRPRIYKMTDHIRPLVEVLEVAFPSELAQKVSPVFNGCTSRVLKNPSGAGIICWVKTAESRALL